MSFQTILQDGVEWMEEVSAGIRRPVFDDDNTLVLFSFKLVDQSL